MKDYYLFLDESKNTPPSVHFALGGFAVEETVYQNKICLYVREMKKEIFDDEDIILHETDLRLAGKGGYKIMRRKEKRDWFWRKMGALFDRQDITVFTAVINPEEYRETYQSAYLNDAYFVCLEVVLEKFALFLEKENAVGTVYIESQNPKADNRLRNHFEQLMKRGTRHLNHFALRRQIQGLYFYQKADLNIGLQIADFIPNTLKKYAYAIPNRQTSIQEEIVSCLYDGKMEKPEIFGLEILSRDGKCRNILTSDLK